MEKQRLFIAVELPEDIKQELTNICAYFEKRKLFFGYCTRPENLHVTLKFLGDVYENGFQNVDRALKTISFESFKAKLGSLDLLPSHKKIRILFAYLASSQLPLLANQIDNILSDMFEPETRAFKNHITLARIKSVGDNQKLITEIDTFEVASLSFDVKAFVLKESELTPEGAIYKTVSVYHLL